MTTSPPPADAGQKPICIICYEDLRPISEDLQSFPICGHVFHELCLQQWIEYCPADKKPTCPICKKKSCSVYRPTRLYFQSTGSDAASGASSSLEDHGKQRSAADAEALAGEVKRLELKASFLASNLENQQVLAKRLDEEISYWKEVAKNEVAEKEGIKKEKEAVNKLLLVKIDELSRKSEKCAELEHRGLALAKELAALKLSADANLAEEDIVKLASLGHGRNHENTIEVLSKSLAMRNKSYKELMAQCNLLGRSESLARHNLDKALEKIKKLKARLQEAEKVLEAKQNGILREMKYSKSVNTERQNTANLVKNRLSACSSTYKGCETSGEAANTDRISDISNELYSRRTIECPVLSNQSLPTNCKDKHNFVDLEGHSTMFDDDNSFDDYPNLSEHQELHIDQKITPEFYKDKCIKRSSSSGQEIVLPSKTEARLTYEGNSSAVESQKLGIYAQDLKAGTMEAYAQNSQIPFSCGAKDVLLIDNITKSTLATKASQTQSGAAYNGKPCGVLHLDAVNTNAGKWNKQLSTRPFSSLEAQSVNSGQLISVGADGRGGRIKILRTLGQFADGEVHTRQQKKQKSISNKGGQSQIENFFKKS